MRYWLFLNWINAKCRPICVSKLPWQSCNTMTQVYDSSTNWHHDLCVILNDKESLPVSVTTLPLCLLEFWKHPNFCFWVRMSFVLRTVHTNACVCFRTIQEMNLSRWMNYISRSLKYISVCVRMSVFVCECVCWVGRKDTSKVSPF